MTMLLKRNEKIYELELPFSILKTGFFRVLLTSGSKVCLIGTVFA
jgi:hypothetical protein